MTPRSNRCRYEPDITSVDKPEPTPPGPLRNCSTCGHMIQSIHGPHWDYCQRAGMNCDLARRFDRFCDVNFSGWVPIPEKPPKPGLIQRLRQFFL